MYLLRSVTNIVVLNFFLHIACHQQLLQRALSVLKKVEIMILYYLGQMKILFYLTLFFPNGGSTMSVIMPSSHRIINVMTCNFQAGRRRECIYCLVSAFSSGNTFFSHLATYGFGRGSGRTMQAAYVYAVCSKECWRHKHILPPLLFIWSAEFHHLISFFLLEIRVKKFETQDEKSASLYNEAVRKHNPLSINSILASRLEGSHNQKHW